MLPAQWHRWPFGPVGSVRDTINRLLTPDISTLWVVGFLLLCTVPAQHAGLQADPAQVIDAARRSAVRGARELAESAAQKATAAAAEYDQKLNAARGEVYGQMDDDAQVGARQARRAAWPRRARPSNRNCTAATARVQQESAEARAALDRDAPPGRRDRLARTRPGVLVTGR